MTAEQLMIGIQEMLKKHPDWKDWDIYNTFEGCFSIDFGFLKYDLNNYGKMPEEANVGHWYEQKWFLDANNIEPDEDLKNKWQKIELERKLVKYLSNLYSGMPSTKRYYDESSFDEEVAEENVKRGDEIVDFSKLFYGDANILIKLRITTKWGEENFGTFLQRTLLWGVCNDAISGYVGSLLDEYTMFTIKTKIQTNMIEYCNGTSLFNAKYRGIETVKLPIEFGNGSVFVVTFEI